MKFKSFKIVQISLMIKIKFSARKLLYENFILQPLFHYAHFYETGEGSGSGSIIVQTEPDAYSGGPKHTDPTDPNPEHCLLKKNTRFRIHF
jgi:hypothetical protein